jgi:flagellar motility protein MotE (MotC chaperone)
MELTEEQRGQLLAQIERERATLREFVDAANREIAARNGRIAALEELLKGGDDGTA